DADTDNYHRWVTRVPTSPHRPTLKEQPHRRRAQSLKLNRSSLQGLLRAPLLSITFLPWSHLRLNYLDESSKEYETNLLRSRQSQQAALTTQVLTKPKINPVCQRWGTVKTLDKKADQASHLRCKQKTLARIHRKQSRGRPLSYKPKYELI